MGRYVEVIASSDILRIGEVSWGIVGIVGRATSGTFTLNKAEVIRSPVDSASIFGSDSALQKSIELLFQNGATNIVAVPAAVTAETQETFSGDGNTKEFTLTGNIPAQPLDDVQVDSVPQVEGTDFVVDYGNKKIIFETAPASGTDNVAIDFSSHTSAQLQSALTELENWSVQLVIGAMIFDDTLLGDIFTHVTNMIAAKQPRMGIYMLRNGETTLTLATTLQSAYSVLIAHKSLKDVASAVCGLIAREQPWRSLTMKEVVGIQQTERFTNTQIAAFDAAFIVTMIDPPKLVGNAFVMSQGWTLDADRDLGFIDQVRVILHLTEVLEIGLTNNQVIGNIRMNRSGLRELNTYIASILNPWVNTGEIDDYVIINPALTLFEIRDPTPEDIANKAALQASRALTDPYAITIRLYYSGTIEFIRIYNVLTGGA